MACSAKTALYTFVLKLSGLFKISFLVGSQMIWFSGINAILPLSGAFGGIFGAGLVFLVRQLIHLFYFKTISLSFLAFCIPGFCASLYWSQPSPRLWRASLTLEFFLELFIRLLLPILCMILFVIHPIGSQAAVYSLYWLIPVALYFVPRKSLFLTALGSTFVAHAVGSVIWCYTVAMTPAMWMGLLPIVALERLLFALAMVAGHSLISSVFKHIDDQVSKEFVLGQNSPALILNLLKDKSAL